MISCAGELVPETWAETASSKNLTLAFPRSQLVPAVATTLCGHIYKEHLTHKITLICYHGDIVKRGKLNANKTVLLVIY